MGSFVSESLMGNALTEEVLKILDNLKKKWNEYDLIEKKIEIKQVNKVTIYYTI